MKKGLMQVAVDAVVFTVLKDELKVLLIKRRKPPFAGKFALPGGFAEPGEEIEDALLRELEEETNVKGVSLQQIGVYGKLGRDPRGPVLSIAYLALIRPQFELKSHEDAELARWFSMKGLPELAFDHATIIQDALKHLRFELQTTNIAYQILPKRFSMSQVQDLYESALGRKLDKRNFRKRIKQLDILKETSEMRMQGAHRPARLYTFKDQAYKPLKEKVHVFL